MEAQAVVLAGATEQMELMQQVFISLDQAEVVLVEDQHLTAVTVASLVVVVALHILVVTLALVELVNVLFIGGDMRYAIIENFLVTNIVESNSVLAENWIADDGTAKIGSTWDGQAFHYNPVIVMTVPKSVTMRQARTALFNAGLLTTVNTAIAAMPGSAGDIARIQWEFSSDVLRDQPLVTALSSVLGLTAAQLDSLFITAANL